VTVGGNPIFMSQTGFKFSIMPQRFTDNCRLIFFAERPISPKDLTGEMRLVEGKIIASQAYVTERGVARNFRIINN
jgi:hypothetical protein